MLFSNSRVRIYVRKDQLIERSDVIGDEKLRNLVKNASLTLSRDSATNRYIKDLGLDDDIGFCPTINLYKYKSLIPQLPKEENVGALISIRTPDLMNVPFKYKSGIRDAISITIEQLRNAGHKRVRILCNDSRDIEFATDFKGSH